MYKLLAGDRLQQEHFIKSWKSSLQSQRYTLRIIKNIRTSIVTFEYAYVNNTT